MDDKLRGQIDIEDAYPQRNDFSAKFEYDIANKNLDLVELVALPTFASNVVEFNQKVLKIEPRELGILQPAEFGISVKCLQEELDEFVEAYKQGDIVGMIDAITDLKYFGDGVLYKMGLTSESIDKVGQAVHEANMEKKLGIVARRGDGSAADAVKPDGWQAPEERIADILDAQVGAS